MGSNKKMWRYTQSWGRVSVRGVFVVELGFKGNLPQVFTHVKWHNLSVVIALSTRICPQTPHSHPGMEIYYKIPPGRLTPVSQIMTDNCIQPNDLKSHCKSCTCAISIQCRRRIPGHGQWRHPVKPERGRGLDSVHAPDNTLNARM